MAVKDSNHRINRAVLLAVRPIGDQARTQEPMRGVICSVRPDRWPIAFDASRGFEDIESDLLSLSDAAVRFVLRRDGVVDFEMPQFDPLQEAFREGDVPETVVVRRMYYLLKDFIHVHQHHEDEDDEIISVHRIGVEEEFGWAKDTLFDLFRNVVGHKRRLYDVEPKSASIVATDALGVLAYARAFELVARSYWNERRFGGECPLPNFFSGELRDSLVAARDAIQSKALRDYSERINELVLWLGAAAVYFAVLQVLAAYKPENSPLAADAAYSALVKLIAGEPLIAVIGVPVLAIVGRLAYQRFRGRSLPLDVMTYIRDWVRVVQAQPQSRGAMFTLEFAIAALLLSIVMLVMSLWLLGFA